VPQSVETWRLVNWVNSSGSVPCNVRCDVNGSVTRLLAIVVTVAIIHM
jgi:hypothetical protein